jgi:hypothetical protein
VVVGEIVVGEYVNPVIVGARVVGEFVCPSVSVNCASSSSAAHRMFSFAMPAPQSHTAHQLHARVPKRYGRMWVLPRESLQKTAARIRTHVPGRPAPEVKPTGSPNPLDTPVSPTPNAWCTSGMRVRWGWTTGRDTGCLPAFSGRSAVIEHEVAVGQGPRHAVPPSRDTANQDRS